VAPKYLPRAWRRWRAIGALPAAGANSSIMAYVALDDSYAAGFGAAPADPNDPCQQSDYGYPALLDSQKRIELGPDGNATCKGAKTSDVLTTQLSALNRDTRLVTLTVGGNDLDVSGLATVCIAAPANCQAQIDFRLTQLLPTLGDNLIRLYAEVAKVAPGARIVVTGYPHLFEPAPGSPNADIIAAINAATDELNATIEQAVTVTKDADVNIRYVDVTADFAGHGIRVPDTGTSFINAGGTAAFHPNADGYVVYADAISASLPRGWVDKQKQLD
jgi:lysophospholipase L1-like esterase